MERLTPQQARVKFRNMMLECGIDSFKAVCLHGQEKLIIEHYRGHADKDLLRNWCEQEWMGLDDADDETWRDSE